MTSRFKRTAETIRPVCCRERGTINFGSIGQAAAVRDASPNGALRRRHMAWLTPPPPRRRLAIPGVSLSGSRCSRPFFSAKLMRSKRLVAVGERGISAE